MQVQIKLISVLILFIQGSVAIADMCKEAFDSDASPGMCIEMDFFTLLFPNRAIQGDATWNEKILECNRERDSKGKQLAKRIQSCGATGLRSELFHFDISSKLIYGHLNYFGLLASSQMYSYLISKERGVWKLTLSYKPEINDIVKDRIDFRMGVRGINQNTGVPFNLSPSGDHAWQLYEPSQVMQIYRNNPNDFSYILKPVAAPIAVTRCSSSVYFPGSEGSYDNESDLKAYKRDPENRHISTGKIQYRYDKQGGIYEGCRVLTDEKLFWKDPAGNLHKTTAKEWLFDNFIRVIENYWRIPSVLQTKVIVQGHNEHLFQPGELIMFKRNHHIPVKFATQFQPWGQTYRFKSNVFMPNNFSTMTPDHIYRHEAGHALGLDDEYHGYSPNLRKDSCENFPQYSTDRYIMCTENASNVQAIYLYIAVSRYLLENPD